MIVVTMSKATDMESLPVYLDIPSQLVATQKWVSKLGGSSFDSMAGWLSAAANSRVKGH